VYGISLSSSNEHTITGNTASNNEMDGISLFQSNNNTITNNTVLENNLGISLRDSSNNQIFSNKFIDNNAQTFVDEESEDNIFNLSKPIGGNYWSDWTGADDDGDGFVDEPYSIDENEWDYLPIANANRKPIAIIHSISPNAALDTDIIHFLGNWTDDGHIVRFVWRSSNDGEFSNGTESGIEYDELSNGTHTIFFKVRDNLGIWSDEDSDTVIVNGKPRAFIDSISSNPSVEGQIVSFAGHGTDDGSIVRYVWRSSIDGEIHNTTVASNFSTDELTSGEHTIYFRVFDDKGVWSEEVSTTLTINEFIPPNQKPGITITSPANNSNVFGAITINGSANDPDGTVQKVEVSINGEGWTEVNGTDSWDYAWNLTGVENRDYEIRVRAYDGEDYSQIVVWNLKVENEEEPPDDEDDGNDDSKDDNDEFNRSLLYLLLAILIGLFTALILVLRVPEIHLIGRRSLTPVSKVPEPTWDSSDVTEITGRLVTCEYCHQAFAIEENERALRVLCSHCGKNTLQ